MSMGLVRWQQPDLGVLFIVTGASGTGKTTLVKEALSVIPGLEFSVSYTTRPQRVGEIDGLDYHFIDQQSFDKRVEENAFLEHATVYGNSYGTLRSAVENSLEAGKSILLEIDHQGAQQVRQLLPESISLFVLPPSLEVVEQRLRGRKTDSESVIQQRMSKIKEQLRHCGEFDFLIVNDDLNSAHDQFQSILISTLLHSSRRQSWVKNYRI